MGNHTVIVPGNVPYVPNCMSNLKIYADKLKNGEIVKFRPRGNSMSPKIESGQEVTVSPVTTISKGDIVLCKVSGRYYVHLVSAVHGERFLISNNHGRVNGWVGKNNIYGKVTQVKP